MASTTTRTFNAVHYQGDTHAAGLTSPASVMWPQSKNSSRSIIHCWHHSITASQLPATVAHIGLQDLTCKQSRSAGCSLPGRNLQASCHDEHRVASQLEQHVQSLCTCLAVPGQLITHVELCCIPVGWACWVGLGHKGVDHPNDALQVVAGAGVIIIKPAQRVGVLVDVGVVQGVLEVNGRGPGGVVGRELEGHEQLAAIKRCLWSSLKGDVDSHGFFCIKLHQLNSMQAGLLHSPHLPCHLLRATARAIRSGA